MISKSQTLELVYGPDITSKIHSSNLLVVGAGGIGCEVMKTLSLTGFKKITIIDLDTIDVSNLNRQFLFRREHVDKAKCEVLRDQIKKQNPHIDIQAFLGRIQEERFGFKFFSQFDLVINALDNEEARKHVNNMCFNLNIPLVDSGTNGYAAQCVPICKGKTPCYQCIERPKDQSFPVCTIRQKPEKMIHCIVWAKALFDGLFGPKEQSNNIIEDIIAQIQSTRENTQKVQYAAIVFDRVFGFEVQTLMDNLNAKKQVQEMPVEENKEEDKEADQDFISKIKPLNFSEFAEEIQAQLDDSNFYLNQGHLADEQSLKVLGLKDYIYSFVKTIVSLYKDREAEIGTLLFNKDDEITIDFVAAAANIRAHNFSISMESKFKIKEMAGKIIPAISSSNALVAALQVIESIKILSGNFDQLHGAVYQRLDQQRLMSFKRTNEDPNPLCQICTDDSKHIYSLDIKNLSSFTLMELVETVFIESWHLSTPLLIEFNNGILYEASDDLDDEDEIELYQRRLKKPLYDLKLRDLSILQVQATTPDGTQDSKIYVQISENSAIPSSFSSKYLKKGVPLLKKGQEQHQIGQHGKCSANVGILDGDGAVCFSDSDNDVSVDDAFIIPASVGIKRKKEVDGEFKQLEQESVVAKRQKADNE